MRDLYNSKPNPRNTKEIARRHYGIRMLNRYIKWAIDKKGYLKWRDLVEQQTLYNIKPYEKNN